MVRCLSKHRSFGAELQQSASQDYTCIELKHAPPSHVKIDSLLNNRQSGKRLRLRRDQDIFHWSVGALGTQLSIPTHVDGAVCRSEHSTCGVFQLVNFGSQVEENSR